MSEATWGARNGEDGLLVDAIAQLEDVGRIRRAALGLHAVSVGDNALPGTLPSSF